VSGSSRLCVVVLSFTLALCPASAGSVSWLLCLFSCCVRPQPALYLGVVVYSRFAFCSSRLCVMLLSFTLVLRSAPAGSVSWCCPLLSCCVRLQPALCRGSVVYSRFASGSSRLCVVVLLFTLALCPAPAGSVSWCCRLLSFCVLLRPALCHGTIVYSCIAVSSSRLCVVVLLFTLVFCPVPAGFVSWCCRLFVFSVRLQAALRRGAVVYYRVVSGSSRLCVAVLSFSLVLCPAPAGSTLWCCHLVSFCVWLQPALCRGVSWRIIMWEFPFL